MSVRVRIATDDDLPTLIRLRAAWTAERGEADDPSFAERFRAWYGAERPHRTFWLAELDGAAVGMTNLLTFVRMPRPGAPAGGWGYLGNMFVLAAHRDQGVGRALLGAVLAHADAAGLERIVLNPTERSIPFYRRAGFGDAGSLLLRPHP